jgi:DNA-binding NtrC family response regulator
MKMPGPPKTELQNGLHDRRVLIIEDSPVVAEDTEQMLAEIGCFVVGPATTMADARQLAEKEQIDAAVVDINIRGGKAFPVLRILEDREIPFILTSGYADWSMPEEWQDRPRLGKPYNPLMLREQLIHLLRADQGTA